MEPQVRWVPFDLLERFTKDVLTGIGVPPADAAICAKVLVTADKRGIDSHGVGRLKDLTAGKAALTPVGGMGEDLSGYKGYGYATVVEVLSAALQQGAFLRQLTGMENGHKCPPKLGHFFLAIDIAAFCDVPAFRKTTGDILRTLRASRRAPGAERIYTCGEKEYLAWLDRKDKGAPVPRVTQLEMIAMRDEVGLKEYDFRF